MRYLFGRREHVHAPREPELEILVQFVVEGFQELKIRGGDGMQRADGARRRVHP
jgi:hypothetical protein